MLGGLVTLYHKTFLNIITCEELEAKDELGKDSLIYETTENLHSRFLGRISE